jgi:hypothetical protein
VADAKQGGPVYFDNEVIDHLLGIVLEIGAELWVVKDRMAYLEELLGSHGIDVTERLEVGRPSEALQRRLQQQRQEMIRRIYGRLYSRYGGDQAADRTAPM